MGVVVLVSIDQTEKITFAQILSNLSSVGGFLSGVGTIIVTVIAMTGLNIWSKQLKNGKFLTAIWEAKVLISKFDNEFNTWHTFLKSDTEELKEQSIKSESEIHSCIKKLNDLSHQLDALSSQNKDVWQCNVRGLSMLFNDYEQYLISTDFSSLDAKSYASEVIRVHQLFENRKVYITRLQCELDELEQQWK
jgi:FtsZ-binding cell division protein ZapB